PMSSSILDPPRLDRGLAVASSLLAATVWGSALVFGAYILVFYALAMVTDDSSRWNTILPALYVPGGEAGNLGIGLHFAGGGLILVLGSVQFLEGLRRRAPALHRWLGRVYVVAALAAAVGGLVFIAVRGTVGGVWMDAGFGLYGILMLGAALQTVRHAVARRLDAHRAWAIRLYALAIGSWLYRMDYAAWFLTTGGIGHDSTFTGPFDQFMDFAFYLPSLLVAEVYLRARPRTLPRPAAVLATLAMHIATLYVIVATTYFSVELWIPHMAGALTAGG
ncbi:MAG: DUF2306 domain-containing protein, partial [Myxococcota bacterium]